MAHVTNAVRVSRAKSERATLFPNWKKSQAVYHLSEDDATRRMTPELTHRSTSPKSVLHLEVEEATEDQEIDKPLIENTLRYSSRQIPDGNESSSEQVSGSEEFWKSAKLLSYCFLGLAMSYLTSGYMQELVMKSQFKPTKRVPNGRFPSAAFCIFSNRLLAIIVAMVVVRVRRGAFLANNAAPLRAFIPPVLASTVSSWLPYAAHNYVSFLEQTAFKSSEIIAVMMMGKALQGKVYPWTQYGEAFLIAIGVAIFSLASKQGAENGDHHAEFIGLAMLIMYITLNSFALQYKDKIYRDYGRDAVDPFQMMLGVNVSAIVMTISGMIWIGDIPVVWEFLVANPEAAFYNILTATASTVGQVSIFYIIKHFGPFALILVMSTRQMLSTCLSTIVFGGHTLSAKAVVGAIIVFTVIFDRIRRKYKASQQPTSRAEGQEERISDLSVSGDDMR